MLGNYLILGVALAAVAWAVVATMVAQSRGVALEAAREELRESYRARGAGPAELKRFDARPKTRTLPMRGGTIVIPPKRDDGGN